MAKVRDSVIDELLVMRCQAGSRKSFELLIRRWQRRLWRYVRQIVGSDNAAWDVTQETWIAILKQLPKLSDPAWFAAWAYRIARNKSADYCRRARRERGLAAALAERQGASAGSSRDCPSEEVAEALRQLPRDRQELLALKYGQDLNILEIAVVLGVPAGTVKSRLHAARAQLKELLEGDES